MSSVFQLHLLIIILSLSATIAYSVATLGCEFNSTIYPIDAQWSPSESSCQTCKCLSNQIVICRNRTCQMAKDCRAGEQLTIKLGACCPVCSPIRRSCLYDGTAILHNTIFYPKTCLQCRCRDGQMFCDDICRETTVPEKCSFQNQLYEVDSVWSPLSCVLCQCTRVAFNQSVAPICYIQQCPPVSNCPSSLDFIPGQCCPVCRNSICRESNDRIYRNGDVWTKNNNCTHCTCRNGSIVCTEETCPHLPCKSNEKAVRLPNSCCPICTNRSMCRFYGNQGYQIYYEHDVWYTSACQYCTCRRHNRIICKSIQCEHQFCLENEIQEARSDTCCVSCRAAKQCYYQQQILQEGSYRPVDNCTLCTCTSDHQPLCYSHCQHKGYTIVHLQASNQQRNHTITVTDSSATIIAHSELATVLPSYPSRSLLFQFSPSTAAAGKSSGAVLIGIRHNSTGRISYRLILIDFDPTIVVKTMTNKTRPVYDELRLWVPINENNNSFPTKTNTIVLEESKISYQMILIILIIVLALMCLVLILVILILMHQRKQQLDQQNHQEILEQEQQDVIKNYPLVRPTSALSIVEKFQSPDLTTKVTLLTHFHIPERDFGTDV